MEGSGDSSDVLDQTSAVWQRCLVEDKIWSGFLCGTTPGGGVQGVTASDDDVAGMAAVLLSSNQRD